MMKVKFYKDSKKYAVLVPEGLYDIIVGEIKSQLFCIGRSMMNIHDITIHHEDGRVERGIPFYAPNGELTSVGVSIF